MKHERIETRSAVPLETRDEGDDDALSTATEAVEELRQSVDEFRTQAEDRLSGIDDINTRLDELETRSQRPGGGSGNEDDETAAIETRAFTGFVRRGVESLPDTEVRSLRVAEDTAGGYLAPDEFVADLITDLVEFSPVRQAARVGSASSGAVILPKRTGITNASWVGEEEESSESEPTFGQAEIPIHELTTYTDISNKMLEDSAIDIEAELRTVFAEDFGKKEGTAFVDGSSVKQPEGFMQNADVAETVNGHASALQSDGLITLFYKLPAAYRQRGVWMMNSTTIGDVRKLKDSNGRYLWVDSIADGSPPTILGRPVIDAVDMPDMAADAYPIAFGDFNQAYRIYDRIALSVLRDPFTNAKKGLVRFHARRRVGGAVVKAEAIRKLKIST